MVDGKSAIPLPERATALGLMGTNRITSVARHPVYLIGSATGRIGAASAPRNFSEAPMKANS
ncbi:hypothetical protein PtoMrB4_33570 [Metapseudomonas otitidis]|uniref:Uncharacterized protein n=1 Tax=Metapseudomonas otitidis TaxID=319939 RepID=A0A679GQ67_9GAMM|nr:hypothetical protein PtoMrB4_33570 [Pseudomonas otitidis]